MRIATWDVDAMIALRRTGVSYSELSFAFNKRHALILYHCKMHGLTKASQTLKQAILQVQEADEHEEKINRGKRNYSEYLKEAMLRPTERNYYRTYYETPLTEPRGKNGSHTHSLASLSHLLEEDLAED